MLAIFLSYLMVASCQGCLVGKLIPCDPAEKQSDPPSCYISEMAEGNDQTPWEEFTASAIIDKPLHTGATTGFKEIKLKTIYHVLDAKAVVTDHGPRVVVTIQEDGVDDSIDRWCFPRLAALFQQTKDKMKLTARKNWPKKIGFVSIYPEAYKFHFTR